MACINTPVVLQLTCCIDCSEACQYGLNYQSGGSFLLPEVIETCNQITLVEFDDEVVTKPCHI
jgi:hypothetical protein